MSERRIPVGRLAAEFVVIVVGVLVAQAEGRGQKADAGLAARQGFIVASVIGVPATILVYHLDSVLALTGQAPEIVKLMGPYLKPLSGAVLVNIKGSAVCARTKNVLRHWPLLMVLSQRVGATVLYSDSPPLGTLATKSHPGTSWGVLVSVESSGSIFR